MNTDKHLAVLARRLCSIISDAEILDTRLKELQVDITPEN